MGMLPPSKVAGPMSEPFDPYRKWLGIPAKDQPPNLYRLLGIATFENDPDVIESSATRQMTHVRTFQGGKHAALSQRILTELSAAKLCLLIPERKAAYDVQLRGRLTAEGKLSSENLLPVAVAVVADVTAEQAVWRADDRWRTEGSAEVPLAEPPPVPIPMPVATPPAPIPALRGRVTPVYRARPKSILPLAITVVSLVVLIGVGGVAAIVFGNRRVDSTSNSPNGSTVKSKGKPKKGDAHVEPAAKPEEVKPDEPTPFPIGSPEGRQPPAPPSR